MTVEEFNRKLDEKIAQLEKFDKPLEFAVRSVMAAQAKRIFLDAKNPDGSPIGQYVQKPVRISPNANKGLPAFPLKGKEGNTKKKNGEDYKTGYFENFLEFKKAIGRNKRVQSVDLFLTGQLLRNWANAETLAEAKAEKVSPHEYVVRLKKENYVKIEEHFLPAFKFSKEERELFYKVAQYELTQALK